MGDRGPFEGAKTKIKFKKSEIHPPSVGPPISTQDSSFLNSSDDRGTSNTSQSTQGVAKPKIKLKFNPTAPAPSSSTKLTSDHVSVASASVPGPSSRPQRSVSYNPSVARREKYGSDYYVPEDEDLDEAYVSDEDLDLSDDDRRGSRKRKRHGGDKLVGKKNATKSNGENEYGDEDFDEQTIDFSDLALKQDHSNRPLWVTPDRRIFLETFSPIYKQAYDFLIAIAEPVCRPEFIHEYQLTPHSLYAAVSVGLETQTIVNVLNRLSKVALVPEIHDFIKSSTQNYGKVKLVLKRNRFYVESQHPEILARLLKDPIIAAARVQGTGAEAGGGFLVFKALKEHAAADLARVQEVDLTKVAEDEDDEESETAKRKAGLLRLHTDMEREEDASKDVVAFEIDATKVENVKEQCLPENLNYPMLEEYDFKNDTVNPDIPMELKPGVKLRPYQEKSLSKMFGNSRARSGIIVLPCGAGKSLVGVAAASRVKKNCLVLCTSTVSVDQWRHQFLMWTNLQPHQVVKFTSDAKEQFTGVGAITISTFTMVAYGGKRSAESASMMATIQNQEWGLMLLDEVHVVPAQMFRKVIGIVRSHCKLGLTATLVREDSLIGDLNFLIGPKLYEANWLDLTRAGHIANVQCAEVWCPMTKEFFREYLLAPVVRQPLYYVMNPNKFLACQFLIDFHENERKDKVIVFSDNIFALQTYAEAMRKPYIHGKTSHAERTRVLHLFKTSPDVNTVFLSKIGDNSLDIPEANVLIQISSQGGSRRQEAQRLGRILRAKRTKGGEEGEFNAFFYTLVSKDTHEMYFSAKRQQFLIDQGYSFQVVTNLVDRALRAEATDVKYRTLEEQLDLLARVKVTHDDEAGIEVLADEMGPDNLKERIARSTAGAAGFRRKGGSLAALSGAVGMQYMEFSAGGGGRGRGKAQTYHSDRAKKMHHVLIAKK